MGRLPFAVLIAVLACAWPLAAQPAAVQVADGDSFKLGNQRYRLHGIDAPELHQQCSDGAGRPWPCGTRARSELRRVIGTHPVTCTTISTDRFGRILATCTSAGRDVAEQMVRAGYAMASSGRGFPNPYEPAQSEARREKRGIWVGAFDIPSEWRRNNPRDDVAETATMPDWLMQKAGAAKETIAQWLRAMWSR